MPRWVWFAPLAALGVAVAAWAFRWGWIAVTLTETDVITKYTALYLQESGSGARLTDCTAQPGAVGPVWILVTCVTKDQTRYDYPVDRFGRLLHIEVQPAPMEQPQT